MGTMHLSDDGLAKSQLLYQLELLPRGRLLVRARVLMGMASFFDAFDALAIAFVLPALISSWKLEPTQIGYLIGAGFAGQLIGAIVFGWLSDRYGRVKIASITVAIFALASLACVWANSFFPLLMLRFAQGLGLGGEVPTAATYVNELSRAEGRGRFFMLYELLFPAGMLISAVAGSWLVPTLGWQAMFIIGALPAVLSIFMRRMLPESPRWLIARGRLDEARALIEALYRKQGATIAHQESILIIREPDNRRSSWKDLFSSLYLRRTISVWVLWVCAYTLTYGLTTWLPTIYKTVFGMTLQTSLHMGIVTNVAGFAGTVCCAFLIDRVGRVRWFAGAFLLGAIAMAILCAIGTDTATGVMVGASISYFFIASCATALYLYTPELYPTRIRTLGVSAASAWLRIASAAAPIYIGAVIASKGITPIFVTFAAFGLVGSVTALVLGVETTDRPLEEISP